MRLKLVAPSAILLAGFLVSVSSIHGTPECAKKEKKACTYCHTKMVSDKKEMAQDMNATGDCYKSNDHSLAKCASK